MHISRVAALLALLVPLVANAFDYDAYTAVELSSVVPTLEVNPGGTTYHLDAAHSRYRSNVVFTGQIRPLGDQVLNLVKHWVVAMKHPHEYEKLFQSEVEVVQGEQHYWMPIQEQLVGAFLQEVAPRDHVTVYVLLVGGVDRTPVFAVSELETAR